jgi:hypothetical protein
MNVKLPVTVIIFVLSFSAIKASAQTCDYVIGDVNNSGVYNGLDVVYSVNYFKGGPPPPYECECPSGSGHVWFVTGDVNASCSFNGLDVTWMVSNLRIDPWPVIPCPDCPGRHGLLESKKEAVGTK